MQTGLPRRTTFCLQSSRDTINRVTVLLSRVFEELGLSEDTTFDIKLAVQEAVVNAAEHGNNYDEDKKVFVDCQVDAEAITVVVRDEGPGFNPCEVPDPTEPENVLREHGRGIFLMRNLCDEIRYNTKGDTVTIVKKTCPCE